MLPYPSTSADLLSQVWCNTPTCAESIVPSTPWSQLHGTRDTHQNECRSSAAKGSSGNGGACTPPSHTHARPPDSCTGKCTTGTLAANRSGRTCWVGASTTQPATSSFHPW